jgi:hypothetical protein
MGSRIDGRAFTFAAAVITAVACRPGVATEIAPPALPFSVDSLRTRVVRDGVVHRFIYTASGPWAINVLEIDRARCWSAAALKSSNGAVGRERTSALVRARAARDEMVGGVNADFFLFTPPGVPTGAHVSDGRVVTGPGPQPVIAFDTAGVPSIVVLRAEGVAMIGGSAQAIAGWNRDAPAGLALFDAQWGASTDTGSAMIEIVLGGPSPYRVALVDTAVTGVAIPREGAVLRAGRNASEELRSVLLALAPGDRVQASVALRPFHPREAVGGRPLIVRDSIVDPELTAPGQSTFVTARHPRTAIGIARDGRRLLLVVVDGRQAPYSDGMSLRELADLMLALGAREALNLDGGGSTAMVVGSPDSVGAFRVANRPSDPTGERAVGNALGIVRRCGTG